MFHCTAATVLALEAKVNGDCVGTTAISMLKCTEHGNVKAIVKCLSARGLGVKLMPPCPAFLQDHTVFIQTDILAHVYTGALSSVHTRHWTQLFSSTNQPEETAKSGDCETKIEHWIRWEGKCEREGELAVSHCLYHVFALELPEELTF